MSASGRRRGRARPARDIFASLTAIVVLLALLAGPPVILIAVFGLPIPHSMPSASLLTHRLQAPAVLKACSVVVWLAWLQLVWCVVAEVTAAVRNVGMPRRVPLAGGIQAVVHRLVTTALLLSTAATLAPALAPVAASAANPPAAAAMAPASRGAAVPGQSMPPSTLIPPAANGGGHGRTMTVTAGQEHPATAPGASGTRGASGTQGAHASPDNGHAGWAHRTEKIYVVQPPDGRFHESLWEIAENHLGDGRRYREIFELNKDRPQPDGSMLTIASLIRPGWILRMPHDAYGPGIEEVKVGPPGRHSARPPESRPHPGGPAPHAPARHPPAEHGPARHEPARHGHAAGPTPAATHLPAGLGPAATPAPAASHGRGTTDRTRPASVVVHRSSPGYLELAAAGLLAAGVLAALERRRRRQARHRAPGRRVAGPAPDAAWAEVGLRLGEDEAAARMLDDGLRYLSQALYLRGTPPPTVFAAHIGEDNLDLWVSPAGHDVPGPWYAVGDGQVWRLPLTDVPRLNPDITDQGAAVYPGLVTIGTDATGRVLVDLEAAHGLIAVTGPGDLVAEALSAMATELATSLWSDEVHLLVVGTGDDLAVLEPDRVRVMDSLAEALPELEAHAGEVADALAASGAGSVLAGRAGGMRPEAWIPHYLVTLIPPTHGEAERLRALARAGQLAGGCLVAGEVPGATWTWEVTPDGRLRAPELGLDVEAQLIPHEQQVSMAGLFESADDLEGLLMPAPPVDAAPAPHLVPGTTAPAEVTLLGPVSVAAAGEIDPGLLAIATEVVVYLAAHPAGVHPNALARALWPRGVSDETRDAVLDSVVDWLGTDGIGRPHLAADASGRLRLGSGVRVDWQVFLTLVAQAGQAAGAGGKGGHAQGGHAQEEAKLAQALSLVGGQFLAGSPPGAYAWIAADGLAYEVYARVADAAHRLCELRLAAGDARAAMDAVRTGLRLAPDDELLWRDLLTAGHATGQENLLYAAAGEVWTRAGMDGPPQMAPETEALLDELLPNWRWTLA